ncbi:MAG: hypothetical protein AB1592_04370 [Pseudomonadota bacterium]
MPGVKTSHVWARFVALALTVVAGALVPTPSLSEASAVGASAPQALSSARFSDITYADLETWNSSGCSFAVFRGADAIGLFDTQDPKKTAVFKIDGKLVFVPGGAGGGAYWTGTVAGHTLRLIKGKRDPSFRTDGGGIGGAGRLEWSGPGGTGGLAVHWEEGC